MKRVLQLTLDNPVFLNLTFWAVCLWGVLAWNRLPKEEFPQVSVDKIGVFSVWPGAGPRDVDERLMRPIADAIEGVEGLEHVHSDSREGLGQLSIELTGSTDVDAARDEVERAVTGIELPAGAFEADVRVLRLRVPILQVGLTGDIRQVHLAERLAEAITAVPGVKEVQLRGYAVGVVRVDLDPKQLAARRLGPAEVAAAIEAAGLALPGGEVSLEGQRVLVRSETALAEVADVAAVALGSDGANALTVGDLGSVFLDWRDPSVLRFVDGQPAIMLEVEREDEADSVEVAAEIYEWIEAERTALPAGMGLRGLDDSARAVSDRLRVLGQNGLAGLALVAATLWFFIGGRSAMIVLWGVPVAFLGAFGLMQVAGHTVNIISTFALLIVTGIVVDDAVIIVENVRRHLELGKERLQAVADGTREVFGAVFSSTATTCLAFAPMAMLDGAVGRVMSIIPAIVFFALAASLFEAFIVLPGHLAEHAPRSAPGEAGPIRALKRLYAPLLDHLVAPRRRYVAFATLVVLFAGILGAGSLLRRTLQTEGSPYWYLVNVDLPPSADLADTVDTVQRLDEWVAEHGEGLVIWTRGLAGFQPDPQDFPGWGAHRGQLKIGFDNEPEVFEAVPAFMDDLRAWVAEQPEIVDLAARTVEGGPPAGLPIDVKVRGRAEGEVAAVSQALIAHLEGRPGVTDVRSEAGQGPEELVVEVDPQRAAFFGLRQAQVAAAVRAALDGLVAVEMPLDAETTEVVVRVAGTDGDLQRVRDLVLASPDGRLPRLGQLATLTRTRGEARIRRVDGRLAVRLTAGIDEALTTPETERSALDAAAAELTRLHPGVDLFYGGQVADTEKSFSQLPAAVMLSLGLMYFVLALQFRSYVQPLIILSAVPLGLAGMILGLLLLDMDLSFIAAVGAVGLVGIVVNDSLVLIDFINRRRRAGDDPVTAVREASLTRLRPILITTISTVLGLLPLALGLAGEEPLLAPMAVSIAFGLSVATAGILVVVPVLYLILEDLRVLTGAIRVRRKA